MKKAAPAKSQEREPQSRERGPQSREREPKAGSESPKPGARPPKPGARAQSRERGTRGREREPKAGSESPKAGSERPKDRRGIPSMIAWDSNSKAIRFLRPKPTCPKNAFKIFRNLDEDVFSVGMCVQCAKVNICMCLFVFLILMCLQTFFKRSQSSVVHFMC